jgi:hypothetical protein
MDRGRKTPTWPPVPAGIFGDGESRLGRQRHFPDFYSLLSTNDLLTTLGRMTALLNTFPWPETPQKKAMLAVVEAGREVRRIRAEALPTIKGGLRELYRTLECSGANPLKAAHAALDKTVLAAYGFHPAKDLLALLMDLNQSVAANIEHGRPVTAPGLSGRIQGSR